MDANQESPFNPFGMDEDCQNCEALCDTRSQVVHGYGDVGAEFVVVGEEPDAGVDASGVPFVGGADGEGLMEILRGFDFTDSPVDSTEPELENVFLTYVTRCFHPDRAATDEEVRNCEPYRTSELRMINPEIIVAVGQGVLEALAWEYTTRNAEDFDVVEEHGTTVRGRGFEILPMIPPSEQTDAQRQAFVEHFADLLQRDYRQTKGRRGR
jgi:uracil-DNA glycosylase family 4